MKGQAVIIGAGPAGLSAAWELAAHDYPATVFEMDETVGGISRTCEFQGYRFDIGGHRFFTKVSRVESLWNEMLTDDFLVRPRLSRIFYDGKFFHYPLKPLNALFGLGVVESTRIVFSYVKSQLFPVRNERTFEDWVSNRFGARLFELFFKSYTEKVWGMRCDEISADWAAQRIQNLNLITAVSSALLGRIANRNAEIKTLIEQFHYPRFGPGQMWESAAEALRNRDVEVKFEHRAVHLCRAQQRIKSVIFETPDGTCEVEGDHFLSTMPLRTLVHAIEPAPPRSVLAAADSLRYRDFLTVVLIVDQPDLFPDNWIYIHSPDVQLGRIQNFKNWSPDMVPDANRTALGLEYFVQENDELWCSDDASLIELGTRECETLGLVNAAEVVNGTVIRMPKAYPIYDDGYQDAISEIRAWIDREVPNLASIGRNGQHRYNNQDHSIMTGLLAAENVIAGAEINDIWDVNVEAEYHEAGEANGSSVSGDRAIPKRVAEQELTTILSETFAQFDAVALGVTLSTVSAFGLLIATAVLLLVGGDVIGPNLSLLGSFLIGFEATWTGALIGFVEAALAGFVIGWLAAKLFNLLIGLEQQRVIRRIESLAIDPVERHPS